MIFAAVTSDNDRPADTSQEEPGVITRHEYCGGLVRVGDVLGRCGHGDLYRMLVIERHWSSEQYEQWLASSLIHSLLDQRAATH